MAFVSVLLFFFFSYCYVDHRDLHSFPTRRSSDLGCSDTRRPSPRDRHRAAPDRVWRRRVRSEEHTSELQSRGHLVCRLLLEKKKTNAREVKIATVTPKSTSRHAAPSATGATKEAV